MKAVKEFPTPTNQKKVKQFTGLTSYYRRYIKNYAQIAKPLTDLFKSNVKFIWGLEQQKSFDQLKDILCKEPVLRPPDFSKDFIVICDASDYAIAAILSQGQVGKEHVICYASRVLRGAERKYSTYEKELYSIIFATEQF